MKAQVRKRYQGTRTLYVRVIFEIPVDMCRGADDAVEAVRQQISERLRGIDYEDFEGRSFDVYDGPFGEPRKEVKHSIGWEQ